MSSHSPSQTAPPEEAARVRSRMFTKVGHTLSAQLRLLGVRTCSEGEWKSRDSKPLLSNNLFPDVPQL